MALMGELYSVQPTPTHSDYVAAAQALLRRYPKRALVIVITNFRDEDSSEFVAGTEASAFASPRAARELA